MNVGWKRQRQHKLSWIYHEFKTKTIKNIMYGGVGLRGIMSQEFVYTFKTRTETRT